MTWADGLGFKHFGTRGLLLTDGLASMISASILLVLLRERLKRGPVEQRASELPTLADSV